ncbi:MAG: hypothetical protein ACFE91_15290, partial [Promethearchaeota archaeon]
FDFLGIFQQILNLVINVIEGHLSEEKKQIIYERIEKIFKHYSNLEVVKKNPELRKISFERTRGFNIINIDPMNCDMYLVEKQLIGLNRRIVEILKEEEGYFSSLKYFIKENIFDYLISNFNLLNDLNLFTFLLQLFLVKS